MGALATTMVHSEIVGDANADRPHRKRRSNTPGGTGCFQRSGPAPTKAFEVGAPSEAQKTDAVAEVTTGPLDAAPRGEDRRESVRRAEARRGDVAPREAFRLRSSSTSASSFATSSCRIPELVGSRCARPRARPVAARRMTPRPERLAAGAPRLRGGALVLAQGSGGVGVVPSSAPAPVRDAAIAAPDGVRLVTMTFDAGDAAPVGSRGDRAADGAQSWCPRGEGRESALSRGGRACTGAAKRSKGPRAARSGGPSDYALVRAVGAHPSRRRSRRRTSRASWTRGGLTR